MQSTMCDAATTGWAEADLSCHALTASSLSLSRCVKAIMMSLCFISSCLYRSTCEPRAGVYAKGREN